MQQPALFHERIEDAVDEVIRATGGRKRIATRLWPDKPHRDAHNLLDACLNPDRREKLAPSQLVYIAQIGREANCHALMTYLGQVCGYEVKPLTKEVEVDRLTDVIQESSRTLAAAVAALERIKGVPEPAGKPGSVYSFNGAAREA